MSSSAYSSRSTGWRRRAIPAPAAPGWGCRSRATSHSPWAATSRCAIVRTAGLRRGWYCPAHAAACRPGPAMAPPPREAGARSAAFDGRVPAVFPIARLLWCRVCRVGGLLRGLGRLLTATVHLAQPLFLLLLLLGQILLALLVLIVRFSQFASSGRLNQWNKASNTASHIAATPTANAQRAAPTFSSPSFWTGVVAIHDTMPSDAKPSMARVATTLSTARHGWGAGQAPEPEERHTDRKDRGRCGAKTGDRTLGRAHSCVLRQCRPSRPSSSMAIRRCNELQLATRAHKRPAADDILALRQPPRVIGTWPDATTLLDLGGAEVASRGRPGTAEVPD